MNDRRIVKSARLIVGLLVATASLSPPPTKSDEPMKPGKSAPDSTLGKEAGDVRDDNALTMKLVWCPPGIFNMEQIEKIGGGGGAIPEAITPVRVVLTRGYWLGKYEVTQREWKEVMETDPWKGKIESKDGEDFPASFVTWDDAVEFCRKFTEQERSQGRLPVEWEYTLPTEAQWDAACRARTTTTFNFGDDRSQLGDYAWFETNASSRGENWPHRVGQKQANPWGLHDMHGNVSEWCLDYYSERLPGGRDPKVTDGSMRVSRGGCFAHSPEYCRSAYRSGSPSRTVNGTGFRVALSLAMPAGK